MAMNDINLVLEDILNGKDGRMLQMIENSRLQQPRMSKKATALDSASFRGVSNESTIAVSGIIRSLNTPAITTTQ